MLIQHSFDDFAAGNIPDDFNTLVSMGKLISKATTYGVHVLATIVSKVRRDHFPDSASDWSAWAQEEFEITANYLHHLRRIGDMLLMLLDKDINIQHYKKLWQLDYDRLYCISQIATVADHQLLPFLSHFPDLDEMTREEVRDNVKRWLGEPVEDRVVQPALPGFETAVNAVLSIDIDKLRTSVANESSAKRTLMASLGLLGAAVEYHKHAASVDIELLTGTKTALLEDIATIEEAISRALGVDNKQ